MCICIFDEAERVRYLTVFPEGVQNTEKDLQSLPDDSTVMVLPQRKGSVESHVISLIMLSTCGSVCIHDIDNGETV